MESQQLCTMAMAVCKRLVMVEHDETLANPLNILESKKSFHSFTIEAQWAKFSTNCVQTKTLFIFASENHSSNCNWLGFASFTSWMLQFDEFFQVISQFENNLLN